MHQKTFDIIFIVLLSISVAFSIILIKKFNKTNVSNDNLIIDKLENEKEATQTSKDKEVLQERIIIEEEKDNNIGTIIFDFGMEVKIYDGVSEKNMLKGVGKLSNDSILNKSGNTILLGHNDLHFNMLNKLEKGDKFKVKINDESTFYQVVDIFVTTEDDPNPYKSSHEVILTFITCYPFSTFFDTSKRYIVVSKLL